MFCHDSRQINQGKILHVDGNKKYLTICLKYYAAAGLEANGAAVPEAEQRRIVYELLQKYQPDILVLTGHDKLLHEPEGICYLNSSHFGAAVREARKYQSDPEKLIIFAGACNSDASSLIAAGANFASTGAGLLHCLDPAFVAETVACAGEDEYVSAQDAAIATITGTTVIQGTGSLGKARLVM